ncbi:MAG: hypothetical protein K5843_05130 [Bacteroidales bacterium]|nr:hypothetical protein [Bacteroidales bacterium]
MKKNLIFAAFAAVSVLSCSKEAYIPAEVAPVTIQASIADLATKVSFDPTYESLKPTSMALTWADGDQLRVYNHADHTQYSDFTLSAGSIGQKTGVFTGTPVTATSYDVEIINGAVAYGTQTQPSDGVTSGLKYLASAGDVADLATIVFDSYSSVLAITAKMPSTEVAAVIKSVDVTANADIFNGGNTLSITFDTVGDADADGVLHFFATLPVGTTALPNGASLLLQFNAPGESHDVYTRYFELPAGSFTAGKLNTINVNATQSARHAGAPTCDGTTSANAYLIGDKYQMAEISNLLSTASKKYFKFVDDITVTSWSSIDCNAKGAIVLDGNNKTISGLKAPLFSFLDGEVSNLNITNAEVSSTGNYYGVLARAVESDKQCVLTNVSVTNSTVTAGGSSGGLIGRISATETCTLTNCSAEVDVTGTGYYTGGFVGVANNVSFIHCAATGKVNSGAHYAAGFIGHATGVILVDRCYSTCDIALTVTNMANHGGLIACVSATGDLTIRNSYSTGQIGTDTYKTRRWCSGILGSPAAGSIATITNCYSTCTIVSANPNLEGAIVGNNSSTDITCSGFVGWTSITKMAGAGTEVSTTGNYLGQEGTISSHAATLGWDTNVWDLTGDVPTLK